MSVRPGNILVTGAEGFIGKNVVVRLRELDGVVVQTFVRGEPAESLNELLRHADSVIHLAGENRSQHESDFDLNNFELTATLCDGVRRVIEETNRFIPLLMTSSVQAELDNPYGRSKLKAEGEVSRMAADTGNPCTIFRLPGVFGKWSRPNYNSVVATFCHNIANDLPIQINDPNKVLRLVYIDDVIECLFDALCNSKGGLRTAKVHPEFEITLEQLAEQITSFEKSRESLITGRVGVGLSRALYSTYVSYLPAEKFAYGLDVNADERGVFVEMLKTIDSGQFSFFTAHPGVTRGGHYHHTKTEKFLVIKGEALFRFRDLLNNELVEFHTTGEQPRVVDTIPGWTHDITNVGSEEMIVMLWANENFDKQKPDTITKKVAV
jgi:UDP-2-acetamido-2,6-beta-L-arabino-hexul-4-ose reductase